MNHESLSRPTFNRINDLMHEHWTNVFKAHFGDEIVIGLWKDLPVGQIWKIEGSTCVGDNTVIEREIFSFSFNSHEYLNADLECERFYRINDDLFDELANLICRSSKFDTIKQCLAETIYDEGDQSNIVPYSISIDSCLKDVRGVSRALMDGLLCFSVNSSDPCSFQVDGIGHGQSGRHFNHIPRVFINHAFDDKPRIMKVLGELRNAGVTLWIDEERVEGGGSLVEMIGAGIEQSDSVLAFISDSSVRSKWVQKELSTAVAFETRGARIKVVPVRLDNVQLPSLLEEKLYINLIQEENFYSECGKLLRSVGAHFWRIQKQVTYAQAVAFEKGLVGWRLPDIQEANDARSCMISSGLDGYNCPFWTSFSTASDTTQVLEGIETRNVPTDRITNEFDCILVPECDLTPKN